MIPVDEEKGFRPLATIWKSLEQRFDVPESVFRPVARIFRGGGGGGYLNNRNQIIDVGMIRYSSSEDRTECPTYEVSQIYGDDF